MNRAEVLRTYLHLRRPPSSRRALERRQCQRLDELLWYVRERSPFYGSYLRGTRKPRFDRLPIIDKRTMMAHFDELNTVGVKKERAFEVALSAERSRDFSKDLRGLTVGLSSGTSGHRGLFLVNEHERALYAGAMLAKLLPDSLVSTRRDRVALFLRASSRLYESIGSRRLRFEYFDLMDEMYVHQARLRALQPTLLFAPPSALRALAEIWAGSPPPIAPRRIFSVAEVLEPVDEKVVRSAFGQPVHQVYQATEGLLGQTCRYGTLHLNEDLLLIEREWIDRESGRFTPIVTDLHRRTQPILRYRLDDVLVHRPAPCPCGSVLRSVDRIEGRADDTFLFPLKDGSGVRAVYPDFLRRAVLTSTDDASAYGVRQVSESTVELFLQGTTENGFGAVANAVREMVERHGCVPPEVVPTFTWPHDRARKLKRIVCELAKAETQP